VEHESIRLLFQRRSSREEIEAHLDGLAQSPLEWNRWQDAVRQCGDAVSSSLVWLEKEERNKVRFQAAWRMADLLAMPVPIADPQIDAENEVLAPVVRWLESGGESRIVPVCWKLLMSSAPNSILPLSSLLLLLQRSERLTGQYAFEHLRLASIFSREGDAMNAWPDSRWRLVDWKRDSAAYFAAAEHESRYVRGWSARALGCLTMGCIRNKMTTDPLPELFEWLRVQEKRHPGMAGGFLEGLGWLYFDYSAQLGDYDDREWFLDLLRSVPEELEITWLPKLEEHAQQTFDDDAGAIREMFAMGRVELALRTVTSSPESVPALRPLLTELAMSKDPAISARIVEYLADPETQEALEFAALSPES
jgi:hypothetical protein